MQRKKKNKKTKTELPLISCLAQCKALLDLLYTSSQTQKTHGEVLYYPHFTDMEVEAQKASSMPWITKLVVMCRDVGLQLSIQSLHIIQGCHTASPPGKNCQKVCGGRMAKAMSTCLQFRTTLNEIRGELPTKSDQQTVQPIHSSPTKIPRGLLQKCVDFSLTTNQKCKAVVTKYSNHPSDYQDSLTHHDRQNPQNEEQKGTGLLKNQ